MFINDTKEIEETIDNVKLTATKKIDPMVDFSPLNKILAQNLKLKFDNFNVIQQYTIPVILSKTDLICKAPTGSGKTLCYIVPIISKIISDPSKKAVIICPVRELCDQIKNVCRELSRQISVQKSCKSTVYYSPKIYKPINITAIYGQKKDLEDLNEADILVATPGRLIDNLTKKKINFDNLGILIFDEADRLYDSTFKSQIDTIKSFIKTDIQTCIFSATYPREICNMFDLIVKKERTCIEATFESVAKVKQEIFSECNRLDKIVEILKGLTLVGNWRDKIEVEKAIIFVERKSDCLRLVNDLSSKGFNSASLHGDKTQFERSEVLKKFRTSLSPILIATSVAARGLDIKDVKVVINFDLPKTIDEYIHRIGRTGRAGEDGKAISFFSWQNDGNLSSHLIKVLQDTNQEVPEFLLNRTYKNPTVKSTNIKNTNNKSNIRNKQSRKNIKPRSTENIYTPKNVSVESLEDKIKEISVVENKAESEDEELGAW